MGKKGIDGELFFSKTRDYLDCYLEKQCGKSLHTVRAYRDALTIFRRYLHDERGFTIMKFLFSDCTRDLVLNYIEYLKRHGYADSSVNQRLSALKAYLWYVADGDILVQPTALSISRVPFLKQPKLILPIIPDDALNAMLSAPKDNRIGIRDRTMMILLYDSAIRMEELLGLTLARLNLASSSPYIRVRGKGDKERIVAITAKTVSHLQLYMKNYHDNAFDKKSLLFYTVINGEKKSMSPGNLERIIKKYADAVRKDFPAIPTRVYPHMFRRTRATNLYQDGVDLELIARILGHESTETTKQYATPSVEMLRNAMKNDAPVPNEKPLWEGKEEELARFCGLR